MKEGFYELGFLWSRIFRLAFRFTILYPYSPSQKGVVDDYPDNPIGITRDIMKPMMLDLLPGMTEEGFETAFDEIDLDGGGEIE